MNLERPLEHRPNYSYHDTNACHAHGYLLNTVDQLVQKATLNSEKRLFDLGCGNGSAANFFAQKGFAVWGVDPSQEGIECAKKDFNNINVEVGSAYDNLKDTYGQFPCVISLEVVEHVYSPRIYAKTLFDLVEAGGWAIVSTPYHGYLKNLALAVTGKLDAHFSPLWDHGHIKFWSIETLSTLLQEAGFAKPEFYRVGRIPPLAKSMIAFARKPMS